MTHSRLVQDDSILRAKRLAERGLVQHIVLYSLFEKRDNRWIRIRTQAYNESLALRVWRDDLTFLNRSIRPIKIVSDKAQGLSRFGGKILVN